MCVTLESFFTHVAYSAKTYKCPTCGAEHDLTYDIMFSQQIKRTYISGATVYKLPNFKHAFDAAVQPFDRPVCSSCLLLPSRVFRVFRVQSIKNGFEELTILYGKLRRLDGTIYEVPSLVCRIPGRCLCVR